MGRRGGSGGRSGGFSRPSSGTGFTRSARTAPPPKQNTQQGPGVTSGLGGVLMQGMAFGAGSEVAHQAVRGMMGGSDHQQGEYSQSNNDPCFYQNQDFMSCLQTNKTNIGFCQSYLDIFRQCKGLN